jgi:hypothetical protein
MMYTRGMYLRHTRTHVGAGGVHGRYVCGCIFGGRYLIASHPISTHPPTVVWTLGCDGIVDLQRESSLLEEGSRIPQLL